MAKKLYSPEETTARFNSLPEATREMLYSAEMTSILTQVGEKHHLHLDQLDALNTETAQVLLGFTDMKEYPSILAEDLHVDQGVATLIANDINDLLFTKIRDAMKNGTAAPASEPVSDAPAATSTPITPANPVAINKILAPITPTSVATSVPATIVPPAVPAIAPDLHLADVMLKEKTVTTPPTSPIASVGAAPTLPTEPPKPGEYKADPYREPAI